MTKKRAQKSKLKTLLMIGGVNILVFATAAILYNQQSEASDISKILPNGWHITESGTKLKGLFLTHSIKIVGSERCMTGPTKQKDGTTIEATSLQPTIDVFFDRPIDSETRQKFTDEYTKCNKEIHERPMIAKSCLSRLPDATNDVHSLYISHIDCSGESQLLVQSIISLFNK